MATVSLNGGNTTYNIVDYGTLFIPKLSSLGKPGDLRFVYLRTPDGIKTFDLVSLLPGGNIESAPDGGDSQLAQARQKFKELTGIDLFSLKQENLANIVQSISKEKGVPREKVLNDHVSLDEFQNLAKSTPKGGGNIEVTPRGDNQNSAVVKVDGTVVNPGVSVAEAQKNASPNSRMPGDSIQGNQISTLGGGVLTSSGLPSFSPEQKQQITSTSTPYSQQFQQFLSQSGLSGDQQAVVKSIFDAISANDEEMKGKLEAAFSAGEKLGDPYWKSQLHMVQDELTRGFTSTDSELQYRETSLANRLKDLQTDTENAGTNLTLDQQAELKKLEMAYKQTLENTRQDLAAKGFTSSTRRQEQEALLDETTGMMRESTNRAFAAKQLDITNQKVRAQRDTALELERLKQLAGEKKLDVFRSAEGTLGTSNLPTNTGLTPLGGQYGEIPRNQLQDSLTFSKQLIF